MKRNNVYQIIRDKRQWHAPDLTEEEKAKGFLGWHSRGYLPHFDAPGTLQFVTYRLEDAMPVSRREEWTTLFDIEDTRERQLKIEAYLDRGYGECHLRAPRVAALIESGFLYFDAQRYRLLAWV